MLDVDQRLRHARLVLEHVEPAVRILAFSAATSARSSTTVPRPTLTSTPSGPSASNTSALTMPCVSDPPGATAIRMSTSRAIPASVG